MFFLIVSVSNASADSLNGPSNDIDGKYTISYTLPTGSISHYYAMGAYLKEYKNGIFGRNISLFRNSPQGALRKSISVSSTAQYRYEYWYETCKRNPDPDPDFPRDPDFTSGSNVQSRTAGSCPGSSFIRSKIDTLTVNVAFKPNTPPSIGYNSSTVEDGSTDTNGKYILQWGVSSQGPLVSGYQWCQEKDGVWQSESACPKVSSGVRSRVLPSTGTMPSGQYRYKVRAYAKVSSFYSYSSWRTSSMINVKYFPGRVSGWQEPRGSILPSPSFSLKWNSVGNPDASDPITHYQLQWSVGGGGYSYVPFVGNLDGSNLGKKTSVTISKANTGRDITAVVYKFRARACNGSGCGAWSSVKQLNPPTPLTPDFPTICPINFTTWLKPSPG